MNHDLNDVLAELAAKLGIAADKLWPILVVRAKFEAVVVTISCFSFSILGLLSSLWLWAKGEEDDEDIFSFIAVIVAIISLFTLAGGINYISDILYPEAAAIKSLLSK